MESSRQVILPLSLQYGTHKTCCPSPPVVQIADFGVARIIEGNGHMTAETGTYRWMVRPAPLACVSWTTALTLAHLGYLCHPLSHGLLGEEAGADKGPGGAA
jgi:hypothetical protein